MRNYRSYDKRVKLLETGHTTDAAVVCEWVRAGRYYDDLTDDEREVYARYKCTTREVMEEVETAVRGDLHFRLEMTVKQPLDEIIAEIAEHMDKASEEYEKEQAAKMEGV